MPKISTKIWNRFIATNLSVSAEVMGSTHEFDFECFHVTVRLPTQDEVDAGEGMDEVAKLTSWGAETKKPLIYTIRKIDVNVTYPESISVPKEAISKSPNQYEHFTDQQKSAVEDVCEKLSGVAERAFQYWLEIIRWVSNNAMIGQPDITGIESGWSTYLIDANTNRRVWASRQAIVVYAHSEITKEDWDKSEIHLKSGDTLPLHLRFLYDAKISTRNGQYGKAIIELAMSCELYFRCQVFEFIPESTPKEIKKYIEEANINKYISQFFNGLISESQVSNYKRIKKDISSLISRRNSYVHMGELQDADEALCRRFINTAEELFNISLQAERDEN